LVAKVKEKKMANKRSWLGMLVMVLVFGMTVVGCVTTSSVGGTVDSHGLFSFNTAARSGNEIATYGVVFMLFDTGYENYASLVKIALDEGKVVTSETVNYFWVYTKITAYAK
jgi:hypothetical protein